ncbi:hypothetical protein LXD69_02135 [Flavobacterium sediminilitoris]|uniref:Uncharacterized protein n=1 Tax=Flavobacterium sediminilitoris TaxID=2024526 RepID=A0ABY4HNX5_9FLAO|nr:MULTISPECIES: hypothetical protein [Flavobacterium]UOX34326.1 hypothetical protein LXD69_02135 [Flavobacterium sediminilitoris]
MDEDYFKSYLDEIKSKYDIEKEKGYSTYLLKPTRAKLRKLCVEKFREDSNINDLKIFNFFMCFEFSINNLNKITDNTDKFRPIETFFKGETILSEDVNGSADMAALLVDFTPRPFTKYREAKNTKKYKPRIKETGNPKRPSPEESPIKDWLTRNKNKVVIASSVLVLALVFFGINYSMTGKACMEWIDDHYEVIDCDTPNEDGNRYISPKKDDSFIENFKKVMPCDTTSYKDKNGNACLWYGKSASGDMEFFNALHYHPETNKTLKEVSDHIFSNYIEGTPCE